jgi:hypothetical protein
MPRAGLEPAIPVFERSKTVHALDGATTGTGIIEFMSIKTQLTWER